MLALIQQMVSVSIYVLQPYAGLLHFALWPACTTDCNCECPCLLCSQHHSHQRRELYLSSGQQQIPPLRDKASKYFGPFYKGPINANVGNEGWTHAVGLLTTLISDALLQACFCRTSVHPLSFGIKESWLWLLCQSHISAPQCAGKATQRHDVRFARAQSWQLPSNIWTGRNCALKWVH